MQLSEPLHDRSNFKPNIYARQYSASIKQMDMFQQRIIQSPHPCSFSVPARYFISDGEFQESRKKKDIKSEDY